MSWYDGGRQAWRGKDGDSILDMALREVGIDPTRGKLRRSEDPPTDCVVLNTGVQIPYDPPPRNTTGFPFSISVNQKMTAPERLSWQKDRIDQMIAFYEHELAQSDAIVQNHAFSVESGSSTDKRQQAFFSHLATLINSPPHVFHAELSRFVSMKKLWTNRELSSERGGRDVAEISCAVRGCPHVAIHGSCFCGWHILNDTRQQLFTPCGICGAPRLKNLGLYECCGHKPRRVKSKSKEKRPSKPKPRPQRPSRQRSRSTPK